MRQKAMSVLKICLAVLFLPMLSPAQEGDKQVARGEKKRESKFELQLVWATNDKQSPNAKHKDVSPERRKRLEQLQLKWANYFEVNQKEFTVSDRGTNKVPISEKCAVSVKDLGGKKIEVIWYGKSGNVVGKQTQPLAKGEVLILGGNAPGATAWFIILKRLE
jgi:hypothetical protein